jgi:hypothetical protein
MLLRGIRRVLRLLHALAIAPPDLVTSARACRGVEGEDVRLSSFIAPLVTPPLPC